MDYFYSTKQSGAAKWVGFGAAGFSVKYPAG
jgi:hypothetical protein